MKYLKINKWFKLKKNLKNKNIIIEFLPVSIYIINIIIRSFNKFFQQSKNFFQ